MTNLASSPTMRRALTEAFDPRIDDREHLRDGVDVEPVDDWQWQDGLDEYEHQLDRQFGGAA